MKSLLIIIGLLGASVIPAESEPVVYAVHSGTHFERVAWKSSPTQEEFKKILETGQVFDSYTTEHQGGSIRRVRRTLTTPSGDWLFFLEYSYGEDGILKSIKSDFRTFTGYDAKLDDFLATRCEREFAKNDDAEFVIISAKTTDLKTGEVVERSFYDPDIEHWTRISALPKPEAEQDGGGQPATRPESK